MAQDLQIELSDQALLQAIDDALALLAHPAQMMDDIGAQIEANAELRFDTKTDPNGQPWAPLSPTTVEIYESDWFKALNPDFKDGIPGSLLQRTNALRRSLTHNASDDWVDVGTSRPTRGGKWQIGLLHEWGTKTMPRRGILTADPEAGTLGAGDQADVLAVVSGYMQGIFG